MTDYSDHPTYGHENRDHKTVTVTFSKPLTAAQVEALFNDAPQLDGKFGMDYLDGDLSSGRSFSHDWEKTDTTPRGVTGYEVTTTGIKVWASEAIPAPLFIDTVRHVLTEAACVDNVGAMPVDNVSTNGVAVGYTPGSLTAVAGSLRPARRSFRMDHKGPKP